MTPIPTTDELTIDPPEPTIELITATFKPSTNKKPRRIVLRCLAPFP